MNTPIVPKNFTVIGGNTMKWRLHYFICILMIFVLLLAYVRLAQEPHAEDVEEIFLEHEEAFCEVTDELFRIVSRYVIVRSTFIDTREYEDEPYDEKVGDLYFYTEWVPYTKSDYDEMYDAVADLVAELNLVGIALNPGCIDYCISMGANQDLHLVYVADGEPLNIALEIKEEKEICDGWYAIVSG